ncbi:hypothetical protein NEOLI_001390 [Neolecta irregularis DAH-3]|uniref:ER membrane protein complex subunit 10 n=1 Tax=Neolecta irregularis (strain DAH-3) TaxID=1198029 RepID=A0A1U7LTG2_NEOID|nr:hypothetical protein NEOLI_001390 [Neolecta irregularis DAH-3]|eukprot:OLL25873.1 hypothetical protein NEOLI_001390 [Neolecta irregularis DAH-3]
MRLPPRLIILFPIALATQIAIYHRSSEENGLRGYIEENRSWKEVSKALVHRGNYRIGMMNDGQIKGTYALLARILRNTVFDHSKDQLERLERNEVSEQFEVFEDQDERPWHVQYSLVPPVTESSPVIKKSLAVNGAAVVLNKPTKLNPEGKIEEIEQRTFFQKYWHLMLPVGIILVINALGAPQGEENAGTN